MEIEELDLQEQAGDLPYNHHKFHFENCDLNDQKLLQHGWEHRARCYPLRSDLAYYKNR